MENKDNHKEDKYCPDRSYAYLQEVTKQINVIEDEVSKFFGSDGAYWHNMPEFVIKYANETFDEFSDLTLSLKRLRWAIKHHEVEMTEKSHNI